MGTPVFFLEPTDRYRLALRRYARQDADHLHQAQVPIGERPGEEPSTVDGDHPHDDPRWPTKCERCDYGFADDDVWQLFTARIYRRADTGEETTLRDAPVGACWNASWFADRPNSPWVGADGRCLNVRCPDGRDWMIDSRASNCTLPDDKVHKCWVRHGRPEDGTLHVDKDGLTCGAGAGSIDTGTWHGFLHHGQLVQC
jgi:hypothetical protein